MIVGVVQPAWVESALITVAGMGVVMAAVMPFISKAIENGKQIAGLLGVQTTLQKTAAQHEVQLNGALDAKIAQAVNNALAARDQHVASFVTAMAAVTPRGGRSTDVPPSAPPAASAAAPPFPLVPPPGATNGH